MLPISWRAVGSAVGLGVLILNPWVAASVDCGESGSGGVGAQRSACDRAGRRQLSLTTVVTNVVTSPGVGGRRVDDQVLPGGGLDQSKNLKGVQTVPELGARRSSDGAAVALSVFSDTIPDTYSVQACADADEVVQR